MQNSFYSLLDHSMPVINADDTKLTVDRTVIAGTQEHPNREAVFVGISLGTDLSCPRTWKKILSMAQAASNGPPVIMIADRINRFNESIFNKRSLMTGSADRYSLVKGEQVRRFIEDILVELPPIEVIGWDEVHSEIYAHKIEIILAEMAANPFLAELIHDAASRFFCMRRRQRLPSASELSQMTQYIVWELPSLLCGIIYEGTSYRHLFHPMHYKNQIPVSPVKDMLRIIGSSTELSTLRAKLGVTNMIITDMYFPLQEVGHV